MPEPVAPTMMFAMGKGRTSAASPGPRGRLLYKHVRGYVSYQNVGREQGVM